jgi:fermentation-respiration switch protein FrsA (DUF1100 family)
MKTNPVILFFLIILLLLAACIPQRAIINTIASQVSNVSLPTEPLEMTALSTVVESPPTSTYHDDLIPQARDFLYELKSGDFSAGFLRFDDTMKKALPEAKLKEVWEQLLVQVGEYQGETNVRTETKSGYQIVILTSQFAKALLNVRIVFDTQGRISGLFFQPAQPAQPQSYTPPDYVDLQSFIEKEVVIGSGNWSLPGTLSLPKGDGLFPAVILVHGSGPNDRDETLGPNKPFRDLAWGLASRGIAVLRYDKRTYTHAAKFYGDEFAQLTLQGETIDDALFAAQFLRETDGIDPEQIFVLGHSLGGMAAPRISEQDPNLAGLILFAAPSRPLEDVVFDQYQYSYEIQDSPKNGREELDAIATQVARVKDPGFSASTPVVDLPLGLTPAYWFYLNDYNQVATAQAIEMPMLILQGERDYQVLAEKDFTGWQTGLQGKPNVTFILYPDLNHLFIQGTGKSTPDEYNFPGHVSQQVIDDIVSWIEQYVPVS